jgi:hypothetical protein
MTAYLISLALAGLVAIRGVRGIFVSADIIRFIRRPNHDREQTDFPTIAFRSAVQPDSLTVDHADSSTCKCPSQDQCNPASNLRGMPLATE